MIAPRVRGALFLGSMLAFVGTLATACGNGTEPGGGTNSSANITPIGGNNQTGRVGTSLSQPLVAKVTNAAGSPVAGVSVTFAVTSGAATVNPATSTTDANGQAQTTVTLGSTAGTDTVKATVPGSSAAAVFVLVAGTTAVTTACSSSSPQTPAAGTVLPNVGGNGICLSGGAAGAEYALVAFNSNPDSTLASTSLTMSSTNVVSLPNANRIPSANVFPTATQLGYDIQQRFDIHLRTTARRELASQIPAARSWYTQRNSGTHALFNAIPASVTVGQMLTLNANGTDACSNAINVRGRVAAISNNAIVVADSLNPVGGFTDAEYASFATTFDTLINPLDVGAFGQPTDIDKNGKILILFTKEVNKLTPRGSQGVIGGFTFERDLFPTTTTNNLQGCPTSNQGEMFYMLVPDSLGTYSDVRTKSSVLNLTIGTIAHEYQHLINAGRRLYINNANDFETVWLNEGLSHIAEELLYYRQSGLGPRQNIGVKTIAASQATQNVYFNDQGDNLSRFELFIESPSKTGVYAANDSLETRGADWNLLRYLADHRGTAGDADTWQQLVNSRVEGLDNLAAVFGSPIMPQIRDWATTVYTDDVGCNGSDPCTSVVTDPKYQEPSWNHRSIFPRLCNNSSCSSTLNKYPLQITPLSSTSPANLSIVAGGEAYFHFTVPAGSQASIDWSSGGLPVPPLMQFSVVRIQ